MDTKTILLVEDNPSDVLLTRRALLKSHITNNAFVIKSPNIIISNVLNLVLIKNP